MSRRAGVWMGVLLLGLLVAFGAPTAMADEGRQQVTVSPGKIGTDKKIGIGLQGGTVSGLSLKYFMTNSQALQVGLGGSPWGFGLNVEYLIHPFVITEGSGLSIPLYVGVGAGLGRYNYYGYDGLNIHVPLGVAFELEQFPLDLFLQWEPGFGFGRGYYGFYWGGTGGVRIYF